MFRPPFNWFNKFGSLPATYKEAMSYEEQIMWLCKEVQRNESYAEEFQAVIDQINESIGSINSDLDDVYRNLNDLATNKQNNLTAGTGILLQNSTISTAPTNLSHLLEANGYIDFSNVSVTDVLDLTPVSASNSNYLILEANQGEKIELVGKLDVAILDSNNQVLFLEKNLEASSFDNPATVDILYNDRKVVASFYETDTHLPDVRLFMSSDFIYDEFSRKQDKLTAGAGISINNNIISATGSSDNYIDISAGLKQNQYIDFSNKTIGDTLSLEPVSATNTADYIKEVEIGEQFKIVGSYILAEIDNRNVIVNKESGTATSQNPYIYDCMAQLPSRARFVVTFENTNTNQPSVSENIDQYYTFNRIESSKEIVKLGNDVYLNDSSPDTGLLNGLYFSDGHKVYVNNVEQPLFNNALFYAEGNDALYLIYSSGYYHQNLCFYELFYNGSTNQWTVGSFSARTNWENVPDHPSINNFKQDLNLVDGTSTTGLTNGLYYTGQYHLKVNNVQDDKFNRALILADGNDVLYVIASPTNNHSSQAYYEVYYDSSSNTWKNGDFYISTEWSKIANKPAIATSINSSSTNNEIAGAKAVYDLHNDLKMISCKISSNYTGNLVGWTPTTIPLDTVMVNEGNCFTLSNNKIIVGAGVSLVRCEWAGARNYNSNDLMVCVYKNDTLLNPTIYANEGDIAASNKYMFGSCTAYIEVQEGDELKLCYRGGDTSGTILFVGGYVLTVTAIKST